eukprot:10303615-Karenia_brevis.AAC.1
MCSGCPRSVHTPPPPPPPINPSAQMCSPQDEQQMAREMGWRPIGGLTQAEANQIAEEIGVDLGWPV